MSRWRYERDRLTARLLCVTVFSTWAITVVILRAKFEVQLVTVSLATSIILFVGFLWPAIWISNAKPPTLAMFAGWRGWVWAILSGPVVVPLLTYLFSLARG